MRTLVKILQVLGYAWVGAVVAVGAWVGLEGMLFGAPGLLGHPGQLGDIYLLAFIAAPGLGLVWLGIRLGDNQSQVDETTRPLFARDDDVPAEFETMEPMRGVIAWHDGRLIEFESGRWRVVKDREYDEYEKEVMWRLNRGSECAYCGAALGKQGQKREIDHIVPWKKGGADHPSNYVDACAECNRSKGMLDLMDWAATQPADVRYRCEQIIDNIETTCRERLETALVDVFYPKSDLLVGNRRPRRNKR